MTKADIVNEITKKTGAAKQAVWNLSLIHVSEHTRLGMITYAVY